MKLLHSLMNCFKSFTRVSESCGSFDPLACAKYEATRVASAPEAAYEYVSESRL